VEQWASLEATLERMVVLLLVGLALVLHSPCGALCSTRLSLPQATGLRCLWHNSKGPLVLLALGWEAVLAEALEMSGVVLAEVSVEASGMVLVAALGLMLGTL